MKKLSLLIVLACALAMTGCAGGIKTGKPVRDGVVAPLPGSYQEQKKTIAEQSAKTKAAMSAYTTKTTPVGNDTFLISDSEASNATKKATLSSTRAALGLGTTDNPSFASVHASGGNLAAANAQVTKKWITGLSYTADVTSVIHGGQHYICTSTHTAGASTEPGVGASWATVWAVASGGATALNDLTDVDTAGAANGSVIKYNGSSWVVGTDSVGSGSVPSGTVNGQVLIWQTDAWVASTAPWITSQSYPGAGVPNSTGSAWGTSYTVGTAANNLVQLNASAQLPAVSAALLTNFPTLNQNTTGTAAGLSGTPDITVGDIIADSITINRTNSASSIDLYEGLLNGNHKVTIAPSVSLSADKSIVAENILQTTDTTVFQSYDADLADLADGSLTGSKVSSASDTAVGVVELATTAETNTGTSTTLAVTPDGLSGSVYGQKEIGWAIKKTAEDTAVADGTDAIVIPASMNGMNLVDLTCSVASLNSAASGSTTVVLRRVRGATAVDMTSTGVTIAYNEYTASDETVDTNNDDVQTGDMIYADVNAVTSAVQKGLSCTAVLQTP